MSVDARTAAMMAHPAGKGLLSAEVEQARMDAEACRLASANWQPAAPAPRRRWLEIAAPAAMTITATAFLVADVFLLGPGAVA